jgi:hypothetical protein
LGERTVLRRLKAWLIRKRFERLFVRPFQARAAMARKAHARGARQALADQRAFLHQALRGRG